MSANVILHISQDSELRIPEALFCPFDQDVENADTNYNSCNLGRKDFLCSNCAHNFSSDLTRHDQCIPVHHCSPHLGCLVVIFTVFTFSLFFISGGDFMGLFQLFERILKNSQCL